MTKNIPVHNINVPNGGTAQFAPPITDSTPVYSSYTGNLVGYGGVAYGTRCDAQVGQVNYGKDYHAVIYNPANDTYMAHFNQQSSPSYNIWGVHNHYYNN